MKTAATGTAPTGRTDRPELVSAKIVDTNTGGELGTNGTTIEFTFDEDIATATTGTPPVPAFFHAISGAGAREDGDTVVSISGRTVQIRFEGTGLDEDAEAGRLTVATVDFNAVEDPTGAENPEGDAPLGSTTGGGAQTLPAGITDGPDLVSVGSFTTDSGDTEVAFTFDEAATAGAITDYNLIPVAEAGTPIEAESFEGGAGTTTHIVQFNGLINAADYARGTIDAGAVDEQTDNDGNGIDSNVLQAADISNGGNSGDPDLVSVTLQEATATEDRALFTFDENIASLGAANLFHLYKDSGEVVDGTGFGTPDINPADARQVLVVFDEGDIDRAVGGQVDDGAVTADDAASNENQEDEVGVSNTGTAPTQTAGKTDGPDLTGVKVAPRTNGFGTVVGADATFTFDEAVTAPIDTAFQLYGSTGVLDTFAADTGACTVPTNGTTTTSDDTSVVCEFSGPPTDVDRPVDAVLGTVDNAAVTAVDGPPSNPEGAEPVTK